MVNLSPVFFSNPHRSDLCMMWDEGPDYIFPALKVILSSYVLNSPSPTHLQKAPSYKFSHKTNLLLDIIFCTTQQLVLKCSYSRTSSFYIALVTWYSNCLIFVFAYFFCLFCFYNCLRYLGDLFSILIFESVSQIPKT